MSPESATTSGNRLRILYVATKPAYPPRDGGRLLIWNTLNELAGMGHSITYVAPDLGLDTAVAHKHLSEVCDRVVLPPARPSGMASSAITALVTRKPLSVVRHTNSAIQQAIAGQLDEQVFDVIHAEQLQAFYNVPLALPQPPVVLRAQNVESQLWRMVSLRKPRIAWIARDEARKMARFEARAVRLASTTIVLTPPDAEILAGGKGASARRISIVRPPFPATLPASDEPLPGEPPVVLLTGGWLPNRDSVEWFRRDIWPNVLAANPGAHLHVFGECSSEPDSTCTHHPPPSDSTELFRRGSVLVVPLRIASGIRMKILEAWARGVPVISTPTGARGLDDVGQQAYLLARDGGEFAAAVHRLHSNPEVARDLIDAGRKALAEHFDSRKIAERLETVYNDSISRTEN